MTEQEIKTATTEALNQELKDVTEMGNYFRWKASTPPWLDSPELVERYQSFAKEYRERASLIESELNSRNTI